MGSLDGKIVLITGSGRGIGRGIARGMAREGASVVITSRSENELADTQAELEAGGTQVLVVPGDITDEAHVQRLFAATIERFGRLDILVNNAGVFDGGPIEDLTLETWNKVVAVNLTSYFLCSREAFRIMKPRGGGRIINVSSISAHRVRENAAPYGATKHAVWGLTQATALDGRPYNIVVSCLYPGNTRIPLNERGGGYNDDEPMMTIDELAQTAVWMASLPPHINMLEATVLPVQQLYLGRG